VSGDFGWTIFQINAFDTIFKTHQAASARIRTFPDVWTNRLSGHRNRMKQDFETKMPLPKPIITVSKDRLGGTPVFAKTRVPVQTLIDYLEGGDTIDDFLADFPSVSREHVIAVLEQAKSALLSDAQAA